jgi:HAD superfamily hydrolase (TIGR01509 family)
VKKAIFWDNDGVLVDTEYVYFEATRDVLASVGIQLSEELYKDLFLVQGRGAWHLARERGISANEIARLRQERNDLYGTWLAKEPRLVEGITDVLDALHGRFRMGVVTSSRRDHFDVIHRQTGLLKYFDFVLTADDLRRVKPDPEPYLRAVERSGVDRDACVAIEDSERGLESARRAGVRCIVVPTALTRGTAFAAADRVLDGIGEVLDVL